MARHRGAGNPAAQLRLQSGAAERVADAALAAVPIPVRLLDVGCGAGDVLRELLVRVPGGEAFVGIDPDVALLAAGRRMSDPRIDYVSASPAQLPVRSGSFDLVVASLSFVAADRQRRGADELARAVGDNGIVLLVDYASARRHGAPKDVAALLTAAGLRVRGRETLQRRARTVPSVRAVVAGR